MDRNSVDWRGYWPAAPTPFTRNGDFDETSFRQLLRLYLGQGVHGILINGSSGEWFSQSHAEREIVAKVAVEEIGGKIPVIIGCTSFTADQCCELGRHAQAVGADGILATPPPYVRPSPDEIVNFYQMISDTVDLPLMIYNIPRRVGINIDTALTVRLADIDNAVALKDSASDTQFFQTLVAVVDRLRVFGGPFMTRLGLAALSEIGGDGYIGGWELLGSELPEFFDAFWAGDLERAKTIGDKEQLLDRKLWNEENQPRFGVSFQSQLKAATALIGQPTGYPRLPLLPLSDPLRLAALSEAIESVGLSVTTVPTPAGA